MSASFERPRPGEPEIVAFAARCQAFYPPNAVEASIGQQREWYDALCQAFDPGRPAGLLVSDERVASIATRRYWRADAIPGVTILYLHGGGFVVGSLDSHDAICAELSHGTRAELVAVDYRLSPEHRHPAASDDGMAVLRALLREGRKVVLCGDSAGGTLAAGLALRARDEGLAGVIGQALVYPLLGGDLTSGSYLEMAEAPGLSTADVRFYRDLQAAKEDDAIASPLRAEHHAGLPPAYVTAAHFDPLRDDARLYAARLAEASVSVVFREEPQMIHAWLRARHVSPGAKTGFTTLVAGLQALIALA